LEIRLHFTLNQRTEKIKPTPHIHVGGVLTCNW